MQELKIFKNEDFGEVSTVERTSHATGFIYILEWDDMVKIGQTIKPHQRLVALKRQAEGYGSVKLGRFALSKEHTNFIQNEKKLIAHFKDYRKKDTELFKISIEEVLNNLPKDMTYKNELNSDKEQQKFNHMLASLVFNPKATYNPFGGERVYYKDGVFATDEFLDNPELWEKAIADMKKERTN